MNDRTELTLTLEDHQRAFSEVSFLLEILVATASQVVGDSAPVLGTAAGRHMAKKLPIYLDHPTLDGVLQAQAQTLGAGFEIKHSADDKGADVTFGRCALRDVCGNRKLEVGAELCKMFHHYQAGMAAELFGRPVRATIKSAGATCVVRLQS
ncbi:MAG: hypothetical protein HY903_12980 [Deltaproteobacteria bacterium]|nr:hypothetical protein [Deltaproteobacteria bacterium]